MEFLYGAISGVVGTIITYPLDTLKVRKQTGCSFGITNLYSGIRYPIMTSMIYKGSLFLVNDIIPVKNTMIKGFITGGILSILLTPLDRWKCQSQSGLHIKGPLFKGFLPTVARDIIYTGFYFKIYETMRKEFNTPISGGIAGAVSWTIVYPLDVIKTTIQTDRKILWNYKFMTNGITFCILRALPLHAIIFYTYETVKMFGNSMLQDKK